MRLLLVRDTFTSTTTLGKLYVDDVYLCETLEDADRGLENGGVKIYGKTCIPRGTYKVTIDYSKRFHKDLPRLLDVPQFSGIRIHSGNTHADTDGCILPGNVRINDNSVGYSRMAFDALFKRLTHAFERSEEITIEVK